MTLEGINQLMTKTKQTIELWNLFFTPFQVSSVFFARLLIYFNTLIQKHRESTFFVVFIAIFHIRFVSYEIYLFEF